MQKSGPKGGRDGVSLALRQLWAAAEKDPVPDEFLALLDRLEASKQEAAPDGLRTVTPGAGSSA